MSNNTQQPDNSFEFTLEDNKSTAYLQGWEAWNLFADSRFRHKGNNPYSPGTIDWKNWNRGWNYNFYRVNDVDQNESEEYHETQFELSIEKELYIYNESAGDCHSNLMSFYLASREGLIKKEFLEGLPELSDVYYRLAENEENAQVLTQANELSSSENPND